MWFPRLLLCWFLELMWLTIGFIRIKKRKIHRPAPHAIISIILSVETSADPCGPDDPNNLLVLLSTIVVLLSLGNPKEVLFSSESWTIQISLCLLIEVSRVKTADHRVSKGVSGIWPVDGGYLTFCYLVSDFTESN